MPPSDILRSTDPCTGEIVWEGPASDTAAVDAAVSEARRAFAGWSLLSFDARAAIAGRYRDIVTARADALARLISLETGKPLWEARTEVASVAGKVDISIRAWQERTGNRITDQPGDRAAVRHRPHGVLAVLGPYNFPAHLPNGHIVPALLAGNTVAFKPSELTPAVALLMADLWAEAGLPDGVLSVLPGGGATGAALAGHVDIDGLLFTGSATTGAALHRSFAGRPDKVLALEMGGNTPLVVWDTPDPHAAAVLIVQSAFLSAGQRCTCARRLIVESGSRGDAVLEEALTLTDRLMIGAPFEEPQPFMGPVISNDAAGRLLAAQEQILAAGGQALRRMTRLDPDRPWLTPALIDVNGVPVADDELFGPVLQVSRAATVAEAFEQARATRFGLAAGLIGGDEALYNQFWTAMRAGIVNWNRPTTGASSAAPFGGVGVSGNHRPSAWYAADYCAYPVAGVEQLLLAADLGIGFRP